MLFCGGFSGEGNDGVDVVDVETDEEGDVLLELERAVESGEGREGLYGVKGGDA